MPLLIGWPLWVWHKPGTSGAAPFTPDTTGWIAWAIWMAVVVVPVGVLVLVGIQKDKSKRTETPAEKTQKPQKVSDLRAELLAKSAIDLSAIADPAMRDRVAEILRGMAR